VAYDVTVSNPSTTTEASYDLTDTPAFPTQVTISDPTAVVVRSNLDGTESQAPTAIAGWFSGGPLGTGQALPAGKKDTYRVSVLATVPPSVPTTVLECSGSTSELGFFNAARMTIGQDVYDVDACAPIPPPEPPATATTPSTPTTTPSTPTTPTTPTKTPSTPTGAQLPNTGVDVGGSIVVALLLLGLGALVLVLAGRRRRGSH
jgi:LPXTG-motif cell wall-anchored protein